MTKCQRLHYTFSGDSITIPLRSPQEGRHHSPFCLKQKKLYLRYALFSVMKQCMCLGSSRKKKNWKIKKITMKKITNHPQLYCSTDNHELCFGVFFSEPYLHLYNIHVYTCTSPSIQHMCTHMDSSIYITYIYIHAHLHLYNMHIHTCTSPSV